MALDLQFRKSVYDYLGQHFLLYRLIHWAACFGREATLRNRAFRLAEFEAGGTVLDLGCGNGVNLPFLEQAVGSSGKIIALDYSDGMLDRAMALAVANGWRNIEFVQGDAACMNLEDRTLDGAVSTLALSAIPGEEAAIARVAAALKDGSRFVVLDAKRFTGVAKVLNPILGPLYEYMFNWNYREDVVGVIKQTFARTDVTEFHSGFNYIAVATKDEPVSAAQQIAAGDRFSY